MHIYFRSINAASIFFIMVLAAVNLKSQNWINIPEIDSAHVLSVTSNNTSLYAASEYNLYKSVNEGDNWQLITNFPVVANGLSVLYSYNGVLYVGTNDEGVFKSTDDGESWENFSVGLSEFAKGIAGFTALGDTLYAGTNGSGVYMISIDNPAGWSSYNNGLYQLGVNSITTSGNDLVVSAGLNLFVRPRNGSQWEVSIFDSTTIQNHVYEAFELDQYLFIATSKGIYRGTRNADSWQKTDITAFPNEDISALTAYDSKLIAGLLYHGQHWIFSTDDMGANWDIKAHEFAWLYDLHVSGKRLWAGRSDGLWYYDLGYWTGLENPGSLTPDVFSLSQNYPNPFNPATTIKYSLQSASNVSLKVYDTLGKEVATLVNEMKSKGYYEVKFDGSKLASGVYIYRLNAGTFSAVKKLLLMK